MSRPAAMFAARHSGPGSGTRRHGPQRSRPITAHAAIPPPHTATARHPAARSAPRSTYSYTSALVMPTILRAAPAALSALIRASASAAARRSSNLSAFRLSHVALLIDP